MPETIGFIGLGLMGKPMAANLLKAGYPVVVHSRSQGPVEELVAAGARRGTSPADVARQATRIITMVPDSPDVELVLDGPGRRLRRAAAGHHRHRHEQHRAGVARRLAEKAASLGAVMLDAPVSGGDIGAINGTLSIMVGGDAAAFAAAKPLFDVLGNPEKVIHIGGPGAGQLCKLCNQMVIGGTLAVAAEALALAKKSGVDAGKVREALLGGFAQSRVLEVHGDRALKGTFKPGFKTHLYAKDMRNVVADAGRARLRRAGDRGRAAAAARDDGGRPRRGRQFDHGQDRVRHRRRALAPRRRTLVEDKPHAPRSRRAADGRPGAAGLAAQPVVACADRGGRLLRWPRASGSCSTSSRASPARSGRRPASARRRCSSGAPGCGPACCSGSFLFNWWLSDAAARPRAGHHARRPTTSSSRW